jgi:hypothetical protein
MDIEDGIIVSYEYCGLSGIGIVRGIANIGAPVIGRTVIVEDLSKNLPSETYPFRTFAVPELFLKKIATN